MLWHLYVFMMVYVERHRKMIVLNRSESRDQVKYFLVDILSHSSTVNFVFKNIVSQNSDIVLVIF